LIKYFKIVISFCLQLGVCLIKNRFLCIVLCIAAKNRSKYIFNKAKKIKKVNLCTLKDKKHGRTLRANQYDLEEAGIPAGNIIAGKKSNKPAD